MVKTNAFLALLPKYARNANLLASKNSAVTYLRCGGKYLHDFMANFVRFLAVKIF